MLSGLSGSNQRCSGTYIGTVGNWAGKVFNCVRGTCTGTQNGVPMTEVIRQFDVRHGLTLNTTNDTGLVQYFVYANCSGENLYGSLNVENGQIVPEGMSPGDSRSYAFSRTP